MNRLQFFHVSWQMFVSSFLSERSFWPKVSSLLKFWCCRQHWTPICYRILDLVDTSCCHLRWWKLKNMDLFAIKESFQYFTHLDVSDTNDFLSGAVTAKLFKNPSLQTQPGCFTPSPPQLSHPLQHPGRWPQWPRVSKVEATGCNMKNGIRSGFWWILGVPEVKSDKTNMQVHDWFVCWLTWLMYFFMHFFRAMGHFAPSRALSFFFGPATSGASQTAASHWAMAVTMNIG